ncbi:folate-binding protein YgfZ [Halomicronema sp. CCY15110]|uniref:CAF17-like 4Fe-4S cluster assembly/insertion protein YgfZ n=1 Tax=Halomicronema sp. CCY15110 TaxID=2767773 RepID=UPI00194F678C|nr:folate-binding protein YgfZ [Halomicronema sp. CCY15110]
MGTLQDVQTAQGATFQEGLSVPTTFGNDEAALSAAQSGVAVCDRSHWGRIRVSDDDCLRFLHNQTTNQMQQLQPGQGCDTVFVTSTGRTLDLVTAYVDADSVLLLTSPGQATPLMQWMDRYIFFADKVKLTDETATTVAFTLIGTESTSLLAQLGLPDLASAPPGSHQVATIADVEVQVSSGSGLALPGFTLMAAAEAGGTLWSALTTAGAVPMGDRGWQTLRVEQGRPLPGTELTDDYNPLEAALWQAVSFDKGCYIGQETIARLQTYQGVKQQLWGLRLSAAVEPHTPIVVDDKKVGVVTSCVPTAAGAIALGYIRTKAGGLGLPVTVGDQPATVVDLPFASRGYLATQ